MARGVKPHLTHTPMVVILNFPAILELKVKLPYEQVRIPLRREENFRRLAPPSQNPVRSGPVTLNKQQCIELFRAVEKSGLDPRECELRNLVNKRWTRIIHTEARNHIDIACVSTVKAEPKYRILFDHSALYLFWVNIADQAVGWLELLSSVTEWASQLATRSIWKELAVNYGIPSASRASADNTPFTAPEREDIGKRLRQIPAQVKERFDLTDEQESHIEQKMDELIEASQRVGRKDWLVMVYGAAFSLIAADEVPPHVVQSIVSMIITGLAHFFGFGGPPPIISPPA